jgi:methylmalonyl-CoA mutase N-terminal domain/subunit
VTDPLRVPGPVVPHPTDWQGDPSRDLGEPGQFPFTRGPYAEMYTRRPWTMRQYAGFGTAEATNLRFRALLAAGQTGLSTAFDLPTQMGFDSDHAMAAGEVGRVGVAIDTVEDLKLLFTAIPLDQVTTSMTINATAAILLAMYVVTGEEQGVARTRLGGTVQNDVLKEYIARGTYIYPAEPSLRLVTDILRFVADEGMSFNPISISGYHMREAGATAVQEVAFTLANALEYVRRGIAAGVPLEKFGPRLSFFFAAHNDLFEEVAKFRAARRLYARLMRERFGADDPSARLRFHTQTGGVTLQASQPLNNVVRVAVQGLAAALGGTQSLHTNAYDEALALPTEASATLALRTQQILAFESGVTRAVDPLAGSWYVESLTDRIEADARRLIEEVDALGGAAAAVEAGFFQRAIADSAWAFQQAQESGGVTVVGVNRFTDDSAPTVVPAPDYRALEREQRSRLEAVKRGRDAAIVETALQDVRQAAASDAAMMQPIIAAVRVRATLGEISDAMREVWGVYRGVTG